MPEDVQTYAAGVAAAAGPDGRLTIDPEGVVGWGVFPFEVEGLALKPGPALADVRDENAAFVVERLVADLGGRAVRG
jgi:hypothetical protein